jgi:Ca2+-binding RTX toxin-like protein
VTRQNAGSVRGTSSTFVSGATFTHMQDLLGGLGNDTFHFAAGAGVDGLVNGNLGVNTLDYTAYTTPVTVNLSAFGNGGSAMNAPQVLFFQIVLGSRTAANTLTGSNVFACVLVGGAANDVLTARTARAILIGGQGADVLQGGPADDLLIGGYTRYDTNAAALGQILAEWGSADSFSDRVNYLSGAVVNHSHYSGPTLHTTGRNPTVFDDGSPDTVTGGGMDWIIPS